MSVYYVSLCYAESWYHMDLAMLAPINLSLAAVVAGLATQIRFRVRN